MIALGGLSVVEPSIGARPIGAHWYSAGGYDIHKHETSQKSMTTAMAPNFGIYVNTISG
jgi:hypothetical protein